MSRKQADHTLADLLQLTMGWFYSKNPDKQAQIEYIKNMVRSNTMAGHAKLIDVFGGYEIPDEIRDINKAYFEYTEKPRAVEQGHTELKMLDNIDEFVIFSTVDTQNEINSILSNINSCISDIDTYQEKILDYYRYIANATESLTRHTAKKDALEALLETNSGKINEELKAYILEAGDSVFVPVLANDNQIYFVSKEDIYCGYYNNNTRITKNFGRCIIKFTRHLSRLSLANISFVYSYNNLSAHPHVSSGGSICSGDASHIISNNDRPLSQRLNAIYSVITTYNPANPYESLKAYTDNKRKINIYLDSNIRPIVLTEQQITDSYLVNMAKDMRNGYRNKYKSLWDCYDRALNLREEENVFTTSEHDYIEEITTVDQVRNYVNTSCFINFGRRGDSNRESFMFKTMKDLAPKHDIVVYNYSSNSTYINELAPMFEFPVEEGRNRGNYEYMSMPELSNSKENFDAYIEEIFEAVKAKNNQVTSEEIPF